MLREGSLVLPEEFIDELWGSAPPKSASTTLQTYVYHLRKIFDRKGFQDILSTHPRGYRLETDGHWLDIREFERAFRAGRSALEAGDVQAASQRLQEAVDLWRGPPLADVEQGKLLYTYTTRLRELRLRALELRIEADLQIGRHREVSSELKSLVLANPLDEHIHGLLMIALYGSGRRHEALERFRMLHRNMVEELGIDPGHELKHLHQEMLSGRCPETAALLPERRGRVGPIRAAG
ncbi:hypothetical protein GCM10027440_24720 [Nocardiopsis coralliicola]